jgi:acyl CoA:acetate/3-ketoacid CoA transferase alpha subunit
MVCRTAIPAVAGVVNDQSIIRIDQADAKGNTTLMLAARGP